MSKSNVRDNCPICGQHISAVGIGVHLKKHKLTLNEFLKNFDYRQWYEGFKEKANKERKSFSPMCIEFYERKYPDIPQKERARMWEEHVSERKRISKETAKNTMARLKKIPGYFQEKAKKDKEKDIQNKMFKFKISREEAESLFHQIRRDVSPRCPEYWIKKGFTEEEAQEKVIQWQRKESPRCPEYWIKKGFTEEEAQEKVSEMQKYYNSFYKGTKSYWRKFDGDNENIRKLYCIKYNKVDKKLNDLGYDNFILNEEIFNDIIKNDDLIENYLGDYNFAFGEINERKKLYYNAVWFFTKLNSDLIEGIENRSPDYQIDHIFSISEGYKQKIAPEIIGSPVNLRMLPFEENLKKSNRCDITKDELLKKI